MKVSIKEFGRLKAAELSFVASLNAKAVISALISSKLVVIPVRLAPLISGKAPVSLLEVKV